MYNKKKYIIHCMYFNYLFLVLLFLEVSCININDTCKALDQMCDKDDDCCTENCSRSMFLIKKYCKKPNRVISSIKNIFSYQSKNLLLLNIICTSTDNEFFFHFNSFFFLVSW